MYAVGFFYVKKTKCLSAVTSVLLGVRRSYFTRLLDHSYLSEISNLKILRGILSPLTSDLHFASGNAFLPLVLVEGDSKFARV